MKLLLFTVIISFWSCCTHAQDKSLVLASSEYPPYQSAMLENNGFLSRIVYESYKAVDYDISVTFYPWLRAVMLAREGRVDGIFSIWKTSEREGYFFFSKPLSPPTILGFYKRKDVEITFSSYDDLTKYKIGSVMGYAYPEDFINAGLRNDKGYDDMTLINQLLTGKLDLAVLEKEQANHLMSMAAPQRHHEFEFMDKLIDVKHLYLAISKSTPNARDKIDAFNRGLTIIKGNGLYQEILESR